MKKIICTAILLSVVFLSLISCGCGKNSTYERGVLTEAGFESVYMNLKFIPPQGMVLSTEEDMLEIMNIVTEAKDANKTAVDFAEMTTVYEMIAAAQIGFPSVSLMVEKLALSSITTDQYSEALRKTLSGVSTVNYIIGDKIIAVEIAGQKYKQLSASLPDLGVIQNYIFRKKGNRMISFVVTYTPSTEHEMRLMMNGFSKLKD